MTVTTSDGATITVTTTSGTQVSVVQAARLSDLRVGDTVMVLGATDNGTIAATAIREGMMPGVPGGDGAAPVGGPASGQGAPGSGPGSGAGSATGSLSV